MVTCALFSKLWLELSGKSSRDVLKSFHDNNMTIAGLNRDTAMIRQLNRYIPIAAVFGGICIALLSIFSDLIGTIGSGTGILLVVNIVYGYYESFKKESNPDEKYFSSVEY